MGKSIKITEKGKNNIFIGCNAFGEVEVAGKNNKFIKTNFFERAKKHPKITMIALIGLLASLITIYDKIL